MFRPERNITRAEFTAIAARYNRLNDGSATSFTDVPQNHWAYGVIASVYAKGWITGYPNSEFKPENDITRAEAITIINRMLNRKLHKDDVPESLHNQFSDLPASHWAFADVIEASVTHDFEHKSNGYEKWIKYNPHHTVKGPD